MSIRDDMNDLEKKAKELARLIEEMDKDSDKFMSHLLGFEVHMFSPKPELRDGTVRELELSEQIGLPIKIIKP